MIGARMVATGAMGTMTREVWSEGSVLGTGRVAHAVADNAVRTIHAVSGEAFDFDLRVDGAPSVVHLAAGATAMDLERQLAAVGVRENVAGMIGNAIRSHIGSGGGGRLSIDITT
jgi:hypothetical protein